MNILEHLEQVRPNSTKDSQHARTWEFDSYGEFVEFQNAAIDYLIDSDHEELLTGILNNSYYGFVFAKQNSHVSMKPVFKYKHEDVTMYLKVEVLFQA